MAMTKSDIVSRIYREVGYSKKEASELVDLIFSIIKDTLSRGEKVKVSGFGNFSIRDKIPRTGRNPQTGKAMEITARRVLTFKPSQVLKDDITNKFGDRIDGEGHEDTSVRPKEGTPRALHSFNSHLAQLSNDENDN